MTHWVLFRPLHFWYVPTTITIYNNNAYACNVLVTLPTDQCPHWSPILIQSIYTYLGILYQKTKIYCAGWLVGWL